MLAKVFPLLTIYAHKIYLCTIGNVFTREFVTVYTSANEMISYYTQCNFNKIPVKADMIGSMVCTTDLNTLIYI